MNRPLGCLTPSLLCYLGLSFTLLYLCYTSLLYLFFPWIFFSESWALSIAPKLHGFDMHHCSWILWNSCVWDCSFFDGKENIHPPPRIINIMFIYLSALNRVVFFILFAMIAFSHFLYLLPWVIEYHKYVHRANIFIIVTSSTSWSVLKTCWLWNPLL